MEIQQAIEIRRSIRAYGDRPVEREKLEAVLRAGNQAPIFGRLHMSVFAGPEQLQAVDAAAVAGMARSGVPFLENLAAQEGYHPLYGAAALVVLSAPGGLDEKGFNMANVSCAAENMLLAAAGLGLGSCFLMGPMAAFSDPALRARLELPEGYAPGRGGPGLRRSGAPRRPGADGCRYHLVQISKAEAAREGGLRFIRCFICFQRRAWACWAPPSQTRPWRRRTGPPGPGSRRG